MQKIRTFITIAVLAFSISFNLNSQSKDFETAKNLNIQYSILRALEMGFVDTVSVDKLLETGINSMLNTLDPYTVFIPEANEDEIDMMTTGSYGGVGAIIRKHDSGAIMIVEPYAGSPAITVGLEPGDLILKIDGVSTDSLEVEDASNKMRGVAETELNLLVKKLRTGKEEDIHLIRKRVHIDDVVYSGMIQDSIGYIGIGGFTLNGSQDVRKAVEEMKSTGKMKRLILDFRNNGGGMMTEAVNIMSLFVPANTLVVSAKGRTAESMQDYYTVGEPIDTITPIMVLVNSGSASASEIVAGAMQDLDRAVVAGVKSFGKGLVQTIQDVGYNASLKLTISKYYTPSGRCVQAVDYSSRAEDGSVSEVADSLKNEFKTLNGRSVYDGGGITPDLVVEASKFNRPLLALVYSNIMSDFAINYYKEHEKISSPSEFSLTDKEYAEFVKFAAKEEFDARTEAEIEMTKVIEAAKRDGIFDELTDEFEKLKDRVTLDKEEYLNKNKKVIKSILEQEIVLKYYLKRGQAEASLRFDSQLIKSVEGWDTVDLSGPSK